MPAWAWASVPSEKTSSQSASQFLAPYGVNYSKQCCHAVSGDSLQNEKLGSAILTFEYFFSPWQNVGIGKLFKSRSRFLSRSGSVSPNYLANGSLNLNHSHCRLLRTKKLTKMSPVLFLTVFSVLTARPKVFRRFNYRHRHRRRVNKLAKNVEQKSYWRRSFGNFSGFFSRFRTFCDK